MAHDYVYSIKRIYDPRWKSPLLFDARQLEAARPGRTAQAGAGHRQVRLRAAKSKACARSTATRFQIRLAEPEPRFIHNLADCRIFGAVAREVVETVRRRHDGAPGRHRALRLAQWKRSSFIVLERNPNYREELYDAEPPADDADGAGDRRAAARAAACRWWTASNCRSSTRAQPRWLSFLNGEQDCVQRAARVHQPGGALRQGRAGAGEAGHRTRPHHQPGHRRHLLQHGRPDRRRLHAGEGGAAPRDQPRLRHRRRDPAGRATTRWCRRSRRCRRASSASTRLPQRHEPLRPRGGAGAARHVRLRGPRRRRLARAARTARRSCSRWRRESSQLDRRFNELWKRHMDALGLQIEFRVEPVAGER